MSLNNPIFGWESVNIYDKNKGDIMQKRIIKAGKTEQYFVVAVMVSYLENQEKYEGMLLIREKGKEHSRCGASEIRIRSKKKETVYRQIRQIARMYPPKEDVRIIDLDEVKNE